MTINKSIPQEIKKQINKKNLMKYWKQGLNQKQIANEIGTSDKTLLKYMRIKGIEKPKELIGSGIGRKMILEKVITEEALLPLWKKRMTQEQIAKELGTNHSTLRKHMKLKGISRPEEYKPIHIGSIKYKTNADFFEVIDSEEKAYVLGFWCADGWFNKRGIGFAVAEKDHDFLELIRRTIPTETPIKKREKPKGWARTRLSMLDVSRKKLKQDIKNLGISERKTNNMTYPKIPSSLNRHFLRGYYDGDGYVGERQFVLVGATTSFFKTVQKIIEDETGCNLTLSFIRKKYPRLNGSKRDRKAIRWLYEDSNIHLERKYKSYLKYWT
jgi:DNA-binding CsgD family transcriptional regulator